jgi:hypothetical protein
MVQNIGVFGKEKNYLKRISTFYENSVNQCGSCPR